MITPKPTAAQCLPNTAKHYDKLQWSLVLLFPSSVDVNKVIHNTASNPLFWNILRIESVFLPWYLLSWHFISVLQTFKLSYLNNITGSFRLILRFWSLILVFQQLPVDIDLVLWLNKAWNVLDGVLFYFWTWDWGKFKSST